MPPQVHKEKVYRFKMNKPSIRRRYTLQQKTNIVQLIDTYSYTTAQIANQYKLAYSSVSFIYNTYKANGDRFISNHHKAGRKKKASTQQVIELVKKP